MSDDWDIVVRMIDETSLEVSAARSIMQELRDHFTFRVPGYQFHPLYKEKMWDGNIRLLNSRTGIMYAGLAKRLNQFAVDGGYSIQFEYDFFAGVPITANEVKQFSDSLDLPFEVRVYQLFAVYHALNRSRVVLLCPTGSGKSLIIYVLARYLISLLATDKKILIVVPTTALVHQLYGDFEEYAKDDSWNVSTEVHKVLSKYPKIVAGTSITIATWQSLFRENSEFFEQYHVFFGDECHLFQAKSLIRIATQLKDAMFRFGTTGTISESKTHELVLEGLFGPVKQIATTHKLIADEYLAKIKVNAVVLSYPEEERKSVARKKYQEEIDFLCVHPRRCVYVAREATTQNGNTLVLFQFIEKHGDLLRGELYSLLGKVEFEDRVFYLHGKVDAEERDKIRAIVEGKQNAIVLASYGVFSTGVNLKNLHNIIFAHPGKSKIRVMQSIGRGLRTDPSKTHMTLYDIVDDLKYKQWTNYTLKHFQNRHTYYVNEKFPVQMSAIEI